MSITKRGQHSWRIQIYTVDKDGKPKRHTETVKGTKKDAERRQTELLSSRDKGIYMPAGRLTVADYLRQWLDGYVGSQCSARTREGYESIVNRYLIPALGHIQLKNLRHQAIQEYYTKAQQTLSARTVHHHHRILSEALKYAVKQDYLGQNPCQKVDAPKPRKKPMRTLTPDEVDTLLRAAHDTRSPYYAVIYTAVSSGLRQGELLALRWRDLDLDINPSMSVSRSLYKRKGACEFKEPKSAHSRRRVPMTPKLALYLKTYKQEQESLYRELDRAFTLDELVFPNLPTGKPTDPSVLSHAFNKLVKRAGFPGVRFHDLRHTFASLMLLRKISPKMISAALGHASTAFTMDTYSHIIEGMQQDAMALLDDVLPEGMHAKKNLTNFSPTFHNSTLQASVAQR